jgi:hypothetical protein
MAADGDAAAAAFPIELENALDQVQEYPDWAEEQLRKGQVKE